MTQDEYIAVYRGLHPRHSPKGEQQKDLKIEHLREINYYSGMFTEQDVKKMEAEGMVELRVVKRNWDGDVVGGIYFAIA